MLSGQLGTAQLGAAQLGAYSMLDTPGGTPPPAPSVIYYDTSTLNYITLPDYFRMLGICP
jgi:hypothetical protein